MNKYYECAKSELDLFHAHPLDMSNDEGWWAYYSATNLVNNQGEFTIDIAASNDYIDLASTLLYVKVKIYKNADAFNDQLPVGPVNNFLNSCFKQVTLSSGTINIENTNITYPYKAYLLNLLNYSTEAKKTYLSTSLFYKDSNGENMESINFQQTKNEANSSTKATSLNQGLIDRRNIVIDGKGVVEMLGPLHLDFFHCDKFLLAKVPLSVKFTKNDDKFILKGSPDHGYKVMFEDVKIRVRHQKVNKSVMLAHEHALLNRNAIYPINNNIVRIFPINNASMVVNQVISKSIMPDKIILAMTEPLSSTGVENKNPFNFQNFNIESCTLRIDNFEKPYLTTPILNFESNIFMEGYMSLFDTLNNHSEGNNITREDWKSGYTIFAFNLQPVVTCAGDYLSSKRSATISAQLKFTKKSLLADDKGRDISLIALLIFSSEIEITKEKNVISSLNYDII